MTGSMKTLSILKAGIVFACILFHGVVWGFDRKELLKTEIDPYLSFSYGTALIDGCENLGEMVGVMMRLPVKRGLPVLRLE